MKSKQPTSKREFRDGGSSKKPAAKKPHAKRSDGLKAAKPNKPEFKGKAQAESKVEQGAPKTRATRAKKLIVRAPNQKIQERARDLKDKRVDSEYLEPERLQKVLAASGVGSRREMEEWITQGMVKVNGKVAQLGDKVAPGVLQCIQY